MLFWIVLVVALLLFLEGPGVYHIRMLYYLCRGKFIDPRLKLVGDESVLSYYASLGYCDWNVHMGNSSYNLLCDFARYHHLARLFGRLDLAGANGGVYMRFKRSITPLERFAIHTRVAGYDEKWLFIEHRFMVAGRCKACGISKVAFQDRKTGTMLRPLDELRRNLGVCSLPPFEGGALILQAEPHFGRDGI